MNGTIKAMVVTAAALLIAGCALVEKPITSRMKTTEAVSRSYAVEPKTIMADDVNINYMEAGEGPWVVLIHGGVIPINAFRAFVINPMAQQVLHSGAVATADSWNYNITELAQNFHVVALDLPGFGGSDKPDADYDLNYFTLYLEAFMEAKGIDKASLVGHGLGGEIAIAYTLAHPEKVDRLVLVDSFGSWGQKRPAVFKHPFNDPTRPVMKFLQREKAAEINVCLPIKRKIIGNWKKPGEALIEGTLSQKVAGSRPDNIVLSREGTSGKFLDQVAEYKLANITTEDSRKEVAATQKALLDTRNKGLFKRFGEIKVPVLIIRGEHDPVVSMEQAMYMDNAFPRSQMIVYPKSGHYPMVEEADRFNQDVTFFLSGKDVAVSGE